KHGVKEVSIAPGARVGVVAELLARTPIGTRIVS
ncbi:MAG: hypothetical protein RL328_1775, partial [Acidobacteriota bacterium]